MSRHSSSGIKIVYPNGSIAGCSGAPRPRSHTISCASCSSTILRSGSQPALRFVTSGGLRIPNRMPSKLSAPCMREAVREKGSPPRCSHSAFTHLPPPVSYPLRRVSHDDTDPKMSHNTIGKYGSYGASGGNLGLASGLGAAAAAGARKRSRLE